MNALVSLVALVAACLGALIVFELRPQPVAPVEPAAAPSRLPASPAPAPSASVEAPPAALVDVLLARPLFSQTRRPPDVAGPAAPAAAAAAPLPRMTGILIDGPRRAALFAAPDGSPDGKPSIVAEGGHIGPFTVQTIEPQRVIVTGPDGQRTLRTSFDPTLAPPPALPAADLGAPKFPGILAPIAPAGPGYGLPQSAGAAR